VPQPRTRSTEPIELPEGVEHGKIGYTKHCGCDTCHGAHLDDLMRGKVLSDWERERDRLGRAQRPSQWPTDEWVAQEVARRRAAWAVQQTPRSINNEKVRFTREQRRREIAQLLDQPVSEEVPIQQWALVDR
jgi:hypothetical protein